MTVPRVVADPCIGIVAGCPVLLFLVTTSLFQDWVICAPAALEWEELKTLYEYRLQGKSGASSRGNAGAAASRR